MRLVALFAALLSGAALLRAEDVPTLTIRKGADQIGLALNPLGGSTGPAATKVLTSDLETAGAFALTVGSGSVSTYVVKGQANGGSLQGTLTDRAGTSLLNKTYTGSDRAAAHQFADDIVLALTKQRGIAGGRIAFIGTRTGHKEVYTCDTDGANLRQLTSDNSISVGPALSPNGRLLAYTGYKGGYPDVYLVDLASGDRQRTVKFPGTNTGAAFSPDGGRIALSCSKDGNPELYVVGAHGGDARRLTHTPGVESSPTWSPDGGSLIYVSDAGGQPQLYRISAGGGSGSRLGTGFGYCTEPDWSPDGKRVAFNVRENGGFAVAVLDLNAGGARVVAPEGEGPVWGADSRHVLFATGDGLTILDVPTGKKTRVAVGSVGKVSEPTWSR